MKTTIKITMTMLTIAFFSGALQATVLFSESYGSENGQPFMLPKSRSEVLSVDRITKISIKHGQRIEKIVVEWLNKEGRSTTQSTGENGGTWSYVNLDEDEYIINVTGRSGTLVDQLTFYTNKHRVYGPYGGKGGNAFNIKIPKGAKVTGFAGRSGQAIDKFGVIYETGFDFSKNGQKSTDTQKERKEEVRRNHKSSTPQPNPLKGKVSDHRQDNTTDHRESKVLLPGDLYPIPRKAEKTNSSQENTIDHRKRNTTDHRNTNANNSKKGNTTKQYTTSKTIVRDHRKKN